MIVYFFAKKTDLPLICMFGFNEITIKDHDDIYISCDDDSRIYFFPDPNQSLAI